MPLSTDPNPPLENPDAERAVLGAIILDCREVMSLALRAGVNPATFTDGACRIAWDAITRMYATGQPVDGLSLGNYLVTAGRADMPAKICAMIDACHVAAHAPYYIDMVRRSELRRAGLALLRRHEEAILTAADHDLSAAIAAIQADWCKIDGPRGDGRNLGEIATALIETWANRTEADDALRWPLNSMHRHMGPLTDELVYIAARESVGKTALVLQMLVQLGFAGVPTALASLESKKPKLVQRMIGMVGRVNTLAMRHGWPDGSATSVFKAAREAAEKIKSLPIAIDDNGMTTDQIRAFGQMEQARGARLLVIDNMKHIRYRSKGSTTEQFREVAQELKWIRDDLNMPVIVLHHLNKAGDVSWSDDIRRDADLLLFLAVDESSIPYTPDNDWQGQTIVNVNCEKARDGRKNFSIQCEFLQNIQTFVDIDRKGEYRP